MQEKDVFFSNLHEITPFLNPIAKDSTLIIAASEAFIEAKKWNSKGYVDCKSLSSIPTEDITKMNQCEVPGVSVEKNDIAALVFFKPSDKTLNMMFSEDVPAAIKSNLLKVIDVGDVMMKNRELVVQPGFFDTMNESYTRIMQNYDSTKAEILHEQENEGEQEPRAEFVDYSTPEGRFCDPWIED